MQEHEHIDRITEVRPGFTARQARRVRLYLTLMGICLLLIVLAWTWVRLWSTTLAGVMSVVAAFLPPVAAFLANRESG